MKTGSLFFLHSRPTQTDIVFDLLIDMNRFGLELSRCNGVDRERKKKSCNHCTKTFPITRSFTHQQKLLDTYFFLLLLHLLDHLLFFSFLLFSFGFSVFVVAFFVLTLCLLLKLVNASRQRS